MMEQIRNQQMDYTVTGDIGQTQYCDIGLWGQFEVTLEEVFVTDFDYWSTVGRTVEESAHNMKFLVVTINVKDVGEEEGLWYETGSGVIDEEGNGCCLQIDSYRAVLLDGSTDYMYLYQFYPELKDTYVGYNYYNKSETDVYGTSHLVESPYFSFNID